MTTWRRLEQYGKTTGIWESGTRVGQTQNVRAGHQIDKWDFENVHSRRLGRGFFAALNRMPQTEYKKIILDIVSSYQKRDGRLSKKQWRYLGLLMTKADPACLQNPEIKLNRDEKPVVEKAPIILRKKSVE